MVSSQADAAMLVKRKHHTPTEVIIDGDFIPFDLNQHYHSIRSWRFQKVAPQNNMEPKTRITSNHMLAFSIAFPELGLSMAILQRAVSLFPSLSSSMTKMPVVGNSKTNYPSAGATGSSLIYHYIYHIGWSMLVFSASIRND